MRHQCKETEPKYYCYTSGNPIIWQCWVCGNLFEARGKKKILVGNDIRVIARGHRPKPKRKKSNTPSAPGKEEK